MDTFATMSADAPPLWSASPGGGSYFRLDEELNGTWRWPHGVSHVYMPDAPLVRIAVRRTVAEEVSTLTAFTSLFRFACSR